MSQDPAPSLLSATNQERALRNAGIGFFLGIAIAYLAREPFVAELHPYALYVVAISGALVAVASALTALYFIRCPKCGLAWLRWSIRHRPLGDWLNWMYRFSECPVCRHHES